MSNTYYLNTDELRGMQEKLNAGDRVILSDMERYKDKQTLKIRKN